jgi:signal transduction histidine kinase
MALVNDLLDLTGIAHGELLLDCKPLDLREVVRSALENIAEPAGGKAIRVESAMPSEILPVEGDAARLQQVFSNLLSNAVKFTPREGSLTVTLAQEGNAAVVRVRDTGVGIAPEFLPSVFEMFRQQEEGVRRTHEGLGIGLALAKRLTELHHGSIQVESLGIGQGTEFTVRLPLSALALEALGRTVTETDARGPVPSPDHS